MNDTTKYSQPTYGMKWYRIREVDGRLYPEALYEIGRNPVTNMVDVVSALVWDSDKNRAMHESPYYMTRRFHVDDLIDEKGTIERVKERPHALVYCTSLLDGIDKS